MNLISWISYPNIYKQWLLKSYMTLSLSLCFVTLWLWVCDFNDLICLNELEVLTQLIKLMNFPLWSWWVVFKLMNCDQWSWLLELWTTINELNDSGLRLRIIEFNYLWLAINEINNLSLWLRSLSLMDWVTIMINYLDCLSFMTYNQLIY